MKKIIYILRLLVFTLSVSAQQTVADTTDLKLIPSVNNGKTAIIVATDYQGTYRATNSAQTPNASTVFKSIKAGWYWVKVSDKTRLQIFPLSIYGAIGNDGLSDRDAIDRAFSAAISAGGGIIYNDVGGLFIDTTDASIDILDMENITFDLAGDTLRFEPYNGMGGGFKTFLNITKATNFKVKNGNIRSNGLYSGWKFQADSLAEDRVKNTSNWLPIDIGNTNQKHGSDRSSQIELSHLTFDSLYYCYFLIADKSIVHNIRTNYIAWGHWNYFCSDLTVRDVQDYMDTTVVGADNTNNHAVYCINPRSVLYDNLLIEGDSLTGGWQQPIVIIGDDQDRSAQVLNSSVDVVNTTCKYQGHILVGTNNTFIDNYKRIGGRFVSSTVHITQDSSRLKIGDIYIENDGAGLLGGNTPVELSLLTCITTVNAVFPVEISSVRSRGNVIWKYTNSADTLDCTIDSWFWDEPLEYALGISSQIIDNAAANPGGQKLEIKNATAIISKFGPTAVNFIDNRFANDVTVGNLRIINTSGTPINFIVQGVGSLTGTTKVLNGDLRDANYTELYGSGSEDSSTFYINIIDKNGIKQTAGGLAKRVNNLQDLNGNPYLTESTGYTQSQLYTKTELNDTLAFYQLRPEEVQLGTSRNLLSSDVENIVRCTDTITLTIPLNFSAMAVDRIITVLNATSVATVVTIQAASGVTLNGSSGGSVTLTGPYTSGVLFKSGTNTYEFY